MSKRRQKDPPKIHIGGKTISLPGNRVARIALGSALVLGGVVGFLPVVGFWMIPAGVVVLSHDVPAARRLRRRASAVVRRWWKGRKHAS